MWLILLLASCCCRVSFPQVLGQIRETGFSDQYKSENTLGEYTFGYNEDHTSGGSFRRETSDRFGNKVGSYGLRVGDGRVRIVNYVADHNGFRADVISNEPGLESQDSNQFSKITKKNIYTVLVPGFKYSSVAPHVTFESNQPADNSYDGTVDEAGHHFDADDSRFGGEDFGNVYIGEDGEENLANAFSNEDGSLGTVYSGGEKDDSNVYLNEGQIVDDAYLNGEYSHDSETVLQNHTSTELEEKSSDISSEFQGRNKDVVLTTVASLLKDDSTGNLGLSHGRKYPESAITSEDLHPFQSSVVLSTSKEHFNSQDPKNSTLQESDNNESKNTTANSTAVVV